MGYRRAPAAYGIDFPDVAAREDELEEAVLLCRRLFSEEKVSSSGRYFALAEAWNSPQPVQDRIPVLIGGGGEKRTLALVAKYADACNFFGSPAEVTHKLEVLRGHCERFGRDFAAITTTCSLFPPEGRDELCEAVGERLATGVEGVVLFGRDCPSSATVTAWGEALHDAFD